VVSSTPSFSLNPSLPTSVTSPMAGMTIMMALLLLQNQEEETIQDLLLQLDSDRISERSSAETKLQKRGMPAVPELEVLLQESDDVEICIRIKFILAWIREEASWTERKRAGKPVAGFQARVTPFPPRKGVRKQVEFLLEIRNITEKPRRLIIPESFSTKILGAVNNIDSAHGTIIVKGDKLYPDRKSSARYSYSYS
jgi:hypothetical protein